MPDRACGDCTACCTAAGVGELAKPPGQRCANEQRSGGCSIYSDRPQGCRDYECLWLSGLGERRDRPDRLGLVFDRTRRAVERRGEKTITAREVWPGARSGKRARAAIDELARRGCDVHVFCFGYGAEGYAKRLPIAAGEVAR